MIKLGLECPTKMLYEVQPHCDFFFTLTHLVKEDKEYRRFYRSRNRQTLLILDNSTNELLEPCSLEDIKSAAFHIEPDLVVAPDYLGDKESTLAALNSAEDTFGKDKIIPVVQGDSMEEVVDCVLAYRNRKYKLIAVPYDLLSSRAVSVETMAAWRVRVISVIKDYGMNIHLLGMNTLDELVLYKAIPNIISIDTGSPVMHGLKGFKFGQDSILDKHTPTLSRMEDTEDLTLVHYNIGYLKGLLS